MNWVNKKFSGKMVFIIYQNKSKSFAHLEILQNSTSELIYGKKNDYYQQLAEKHWLSLQHDAKHSLC